MTSLWYWIVFALAVAVCVLAGLLFRLEARREARRKREWARFMQRTRL